jgi:hypothetical protein
MMKTLYIIATALFGTALLAFWGTAVGIASGPAPGGPAGATAPAGKRFTLADVAAHGTPGDCWMAIGGVVYDVSAYVPRHPAPLSVIAEWCGKDATRAYATKNRARPHSARATGLLGQYELGFLDAARPD